MTDNATQYQPLRITPATISADIRYWKRQAIKNQRQVEELEEMLLEAQAKLENNKFYFRAYQQAERRSIVKYFGEVLNQSLPVALDPQVISIAKQEWIEGWDWSMNEGTKINPYAPDTPQWTGWQDGFESAVRNREAIKHRKQCLAYQEAEKVEAEKVEAGR